MKSLSFEQFKQISQVYIEQLDNVAKPKVKKPRIRISVSEHFKGIGLTSNLSAETAKRLNIPDMLIGYGQQIKGLNRTKAIEPTKQKRHNKADKQAAILAAKLKAEKIATKGLEVRHILLSDTAKRIKCKQRVEAIAKHRQCKGLFTELSNLINIS